MVAKHMYIVIIVIIVTIIIIIINIFYYFDTWSCVPYMRSSPYLMVLHCYHVVSGTQRTDACSESNVTLW